MKTEKLKILFKGGSKDNQIEEVIIKNYYFYEFWNNTNMKLEVYIRDNKFKKNEEPYDDIFKCIGWKSEEYKP